MPTQRITFLRFTTIQTLREVNAYSEIEGLEQAIAELAENTRQIGWDDENGDEEDSEDVAVDGFGGRSSIYSAEDRPGDDEVIRNGVGVGTEVAGGEGDSSEGEREGDGIADERGDAGVGVARARNSVEMIRRESNGWRRRGVKWWLKRVGRVLKRKCSLA